MTIFKVHPDGGQRTYPGATVRGIWAFMWISVWLLTQEEVQKHQDQKGFHKIKSPWNLIFFRSWCKASGFGWKLVKIIFGAGNYTCNIECAKGLLVPEECQFVLPVPNSKWSILFGKQKLSGSDWNWITTTVMLWLYGTANLSRYFSLTVGLEHTNSLGSGAKALTSSSSLRALKGVNITTLKSKVVVTLYIFTHAKTTQIKRERKRTKHIF